MPGRGRGRGGRFSGGRSVGLGTRNSNASRSVTDRYYSPAEWDRLSMEQRDQVRSLREERDKK